MNPEKPKKNKFLTFLKVVIALVFLLVPYRISESKSGEFHIHAVLYQVLKKKEKVEEDTADQPKFEYIITLPGLLSDQYETCKKLCLRLFQR